MQNIIWTGVDLKAALSGIVSCEIPINFVGGKIEFNTNNLNSGEIFIALPGEKRNGHEFILDAFRRGAAAAIIDEDYPVVSPIAKDSILIKVSNTYDALNALAKYKRIHSSAQFIGVTGSVGKTSTKESLFKILSQFGESYANSGNYNNYLGVPLSLCALTGRELYSVNEIGMSHAGEIRPLTHLVRPDIAIITHVAEAHLGHFQSIEDIVRAKCEIFEGMNSPKESGSGKVAIINRDSELFTLQYQLAKNQGVDIITFGEHPEANCRLVDYRHKADIAELHFTIAGMALSGQTSLTGKHHALNLAAVIAATYTLDLDLKKVMDVITHLKPVEGRGNIHHYTLNGKNITLIDDAYNANPASVKASLMSFANIKSNNKTAILADMKELGEKEQQLHSDLAEVVIKSKINHLITIGPLMQHLGNAVENDLPVTYYNTASPETFSNIMQKFTQDEFVLIKGSKSTKLRDFIKYLADQ